MKYVTLLFACLAAYCAAAQNTASAAGRSGNPVFPGWYADPEGVVFGDTYWIYPTYSADYDEQTFMDAFSSKDLVHWQKHPRIVSNDEVKWVKRAMWAPAAVHANGKYYLFFAGNDIHEGETGGIGVAVADSPAGPFRDALGKPLIDSIVNGAQPIDQFVFRDDDGSYYMYYGGWGHCNMVRLAPDLLRIVPFDDGTLYKEVTPRITPRGRSCSGTAGNITSCGRKGLDGPRLLRRLRHRRLALRAVRTHRQDPRTRPGDRPRRRAPLRHTGSGAGRMVHRLPPPPAGRNGSQQP